MKQTRTYLIAGLGNPGIEYDKTRHNTGFGIINLLLKDLKIELDKNKYKALYTIYKNGDNKYIIVKPQTFMNSSGEAISKLCNFYKVKNEDVIICYDDLDLPVGKLRLRKSGSAGGHNGIKSIISLLNSEDFKRVRVGISKDSKIEVIDYVLGRFKGEDLKAHKAGMIKAKDSLVYFIECNDFDKVMSKFN